MPVFAVGTNITGTLHGRSSVACNDNKLGPLSVFDDYKFSLGLDSDECISLLSQDWFHGVMGASLSPTEDCVLIFEISKYRHVRSCLEMSEANGVDGGAFRKRNLTHLQLAEKSKAPEAERHLETWDLDPSLVPTYSTYSRECFRDTRVSILSAVGFNLGSRHICRESTTGRAQVVIEALRSCDIVVKSRVSVSSWVPKCSYLHVVGPGSVVLAIYRYLNLIYNKLYNFDNKLSQLLPSEWLLI
ncbi:hypothetical protein V1478_002005 [Vespula squamosa]|uniref:Uncharacterized protein n=1 Tax=Vespula squamosa TaxID=30214 RepID=A0ABD2BYR3_VESSQ